MAGARPVFVDVDARTLSSTSTRRGRLHQRTRAIIPVHLYGHPVDMDRLMPLAREAGLR